MNTIRNLCGACGAGYDTQQPQCPYCNSSDPQGITLKPLVFDTECYASYWLFEALDPITHALHVFELYDGHPLNAIGLRNLLTTRTMISFNGIHYDMPMVTLALSGATTQALKAANDQLIVGQMKHWEFYREYRLQEPTSVDHIDMIEVAPGQASLKAYMGKMHSKTLRDLPYDPNAVVNEAMRKVLREEYCPNDLSGTLELFNTFQEQIALRVEMSDEYGVDLRSKSDAQIAEAALIATLGYRPRTGDIPTGTEFNYQPPAWLKFNTPRLQFMLDTLSYAHPFVVNPTGGVSPAFNSRTLDWPDKAVRCDTHGNWVLRPKDWRHETVRIGSAEYAMGIGGLHSTESKIAWRASASKSLRSPDVRSYYPSLIRELRITPPAIGERFYEIYSGWYDDRLIAKKAKIKKKANSLKTLLNGCGGKLNSKYSCMRSPSGFIQMTLTGQFALLMLVEALESAGITVVSVNTDGLVLYADRDLDWFADSVIAWWEATTGFVMEMTDFDLVAAQGVNSYVAITTDNELKLKGAFAPPEPGASGWPNPTGQICVDAMVAYLRDGIPLRDTIEACTDIRQFVYVRTVKGGGSYCPVQVLPKTTTLTAMRAALGTTVTGNNAELRVQYELLRQHRMASTEYLGKVVRWAYVLGSQGCILTPEGNLVPRTTGCQPMMTLPDTLPANIDYDWYIREAESLLSDVGLGK
jgi:hypothetical protein